MILADKIIELRKKNGWSQEELAEKLGVSRQAVSKWEGSQSVPDLNKILHMSKLFGVSTDYLLKDDIQVVEYADSEESNLRKVTMAEANEFLGLKRFTAGKIAFATFLCIISPICLIILASLSESGVLVFSEDASASIGLVVMFLLVAVAVIIFIQCGNKTAGFEFLEKESFETEYGVTGMVNERKAEFRKTYERNNIIGTVCCIFSVIPLFATAFLDDDVISIAATAFLLLIVAIGVIFFVTGGVIWESFKKLNQEGEYAVEVKKKSAYGAAIGTIYWLVATAVFLAWSFGTDSWDQSWIVWPIAGILYAALVTMVNTFTKNNRQD